jgi:hypothetical protein
VAHPRQHAAGLGGAAVTDYNAIAHAYRNTKRLPIKQYGKEFTLFQILGSSRDLSVLDVACGESYYARAMR